jgi:hypothetical protein
VLLVSKARLDDAARGFRAAGTLDHVPRSHLSLSVFFRNLGNWPACVAELNEVEEVAELGPMRLFFCDVAFERARLAFARIEAFAPLNGVLEQDDPPKPVVPRADKIAELKGDAAKQIKIADDYIQSCGYHRRDEELAELKDVLAGKRKFADLPPRV